MSFLAFGINHKTASVEIREKVAFDLTKLGDALDKIVQSVEYRRIEEIKKALGI